ncbi:MAG: carboxypeptidase-like regulatory domain-containing protein, partial [Anaerohalosphaeraceae bacterium]
MVNSIGFMVRFVMVYAFLGIFSGIVSAESVRLSGRVVDAQGKGLKDAYVFLYEIISDQSGLCVARDLTQKTKSDADGNFSFVQDKKPVAGREAVVLAAMEGQSIRWAAWDMMMDKEVVLALGEYGTISGIVQDIEGRPLGNAPVRALLKIASPEPGNRIYCFDRLTKTTDASGRFSFDFIPKDAVAEFYVESAGKISFYGAVRNFSELPFQYKPGDRDVLISVCDESGVSGTVIGPDMKPVAGVELLVSGMFTVGPAGQTATTDANGKFQVNHLGSGLYSIYLSHSEVNASWASEPVNVLLGKGEKNEGVTLRVMKAGGITFIVQDAQSGTEIPNCSVWLMRQGERFDNGLFSSWRSENEDSLTYKVLAGDYIYKIYAEGYRSYSDNKPIKVQEGESVSITAKLESLPQIKGVVRDSKGGNVDQARVLIFPGGSRVITNSNGEFQAYFDDEQTEDEAWIYCEDSLQQSAAIQPVSKDKPSVSIQLKKTLPLRGRVVNEKAKGVADASIGLYLIDSQNQSHLLRSNCVTDQFGNYSNLGVVPGYRYQIMVYGRSQRAASPVFEAPLGSFSMQLDSITLGITRITGQVVDEQSRSIDGASVFLYDVIKSDQDGSGFEVKLAGESVSDSAGQYSIELQGEREGIDHSFVMVSKQDYAVGIEWYSPDKPNIKPVVLSSGPKTFSGVIKDSAGNPLSGVSVSVYVSEYQKNYSDSAYYYDIAKEAAQTELLKTVTGQDGVFVISHIPPYAKGEFMIRGEGYAPLYTGKPSFRQEELSIPAGRPGLAFVLQRWSGICGVVSDQETGKPIAGEKVFIAKAGQVMMAMSAWSSMTGTHALKTENKDNDELVTDENGYFQADRLTPGRYRVTLDTFSATTRRWCAQPQDVEVVEGQSVEVKVPAVRLGTITVSVIDSQRQTPVSGAMVYVVPENAESNAGENTLSTVIPLNTITYVPAGGSLEENGQVLTHLDYGSNKETVIPVKTNEQGKAVFYVAPGAYSVNKVVKQSYEYTAGSERIEVASKGSHEITVKMTALPGICGVCRNSAGQPVPSAEIRELGYLEILAVTDGQGWFQFDPAALKDPGSPTGIILVASQSQLQLGGCGKVVSNKTNALELKPAVLVSGQLVEPAGNSVPEALIHVFSTEKYITSSSERRPETKLTPYTEVHTDLFGKFSLLAIPDLSYVIQIAVDGYGVVEETIVNIAKS